MKNLILFFLCFTLAQTSWGAIDPLVNATDHRDLDSKALKAAESSARDSQKMRAAESLGRILKPQGLDRLFGFLNASSPHVVEKAIFSLGQFGWKPEFSGGRVDEIRSRLVPLLKNNSSRIRQLTVEALGKLSDDKTILDLSPQLTDKSAAVRAEAILAFYRSRLIWGQRNQGKTQADYPQIIFQGIQNLANDRNSDVRGTVAYFFARAKDKRGTEILLKLVTDRNPWTRFFAATALGEMGVKGPSELFGKVSQSLVILTRDFEGAVRSAAVESLGKIDAAELIPDSTMKDKNFHVRLKAVAALGKSKKVSQDKIKAFSQDKSIMVRAETLKALVTHEPDQAKLLLESATDSKDWLVRRAAVEASSTLGSFQESYLTKIWQQEKDLRIELAIVDAMSAIKTKSAYDFMVQTLSHSDVALRNLGSGDLVSREEPQKIQDAWSAYNLNLDKKYEAVRESLIDVMDSVENPQTNDFLTKMLKDPSYSNQRKAYEVLKKRKVPNLTEPTEIFTDTPFRDLTFAQDPIITLETTKGKIVIKCFAKEAPLHVANFVGLVKKGNYNGLTWHRIETNFVVQGGGHSDGSVRADYTLRAEINQIPFHKGMVGMPRSDHFDSGDWEIFIDQVPTPHLDGQYTVFGQVISGLSLLDKLEIGDLIVKASVN